MKKCSKCHIEKDKSEFGKYSKASDGLLQYCKTCWRAIGKAWKIKNIEKAKISWRASAKRQREKDPKRIKKKEWELKNPDKVKKTRKKAWQKFYAKDENYKKIYAAQKSWAKENPDKIKEYGRRAAKLARIKYPEKDKARKLAEYAVEIGLMIRPTICSRCNKEGKIEGHHPDYNKPLEVIWLCKKCHNEEHVKSRAQ